MAEHPHKALDLLAQIAPREALARARELARAIERDEYVKEYISRRALRVAVAGMVTTLGFGAAALLLLAGLSPYLALVAPWLKITVLLCVMAAWAVATVFVMYLFLAAMQRAALAEKDRRA